MIFSVLFYNSCRRERLTAGNIPENRGVAQFGRALRSGRRGRRFKSCRIDFLSDKIKRVCIYCLLGTLRFSGKIIYTDFFYTDPM